METNMFQFSLKLGIAASLGCIMLGQSLPSAAQSAANYPAKPVTIVMPFPAGGMGDVLARLLANELTAEWKQSVIVENKPGASGMIGNGYVARASPDGYTLLIAITQVVQAPSLIPNLQYDIVKDFTPLSKLVNARSIFVTSANSDINSLKDYAVLARANPGKYSFGSYGTGTTAHIQGEIFNKRNSIKATHIPYKGSAPLVNDLLGGHVTLSFMDMSTTLPFISSGKLKGHAVSGTTRSPVLPDTPTFKELGYSGFEVSGWYGLFAPAGLPPDIAKKISSTVARIVQSPETKAKLIKLGLEPEGTTGEDFARIIKSDMDVWKGTIKEGDVSIN
jgi:tripartite-type tricarboxylate transporter receptor subunit TctC